MILIADSGSTKCDWALVAPDGRAAGAFETRGMNPYFHTEEVVEQYLRENNALINRANEITHVFFYGAGSSSPAMCAIIERGLKRVFVNAAILVEHDLLGCAYATYTGEPSIACILGTGSNSCYFDGTQVSEAVPSLAYILGDEASGSYYGKMLLRAYFYKKLPADLSAAFEETFHLTKEEVLQKIYREPGANVWLASFMTFVGRFAHHPFMAEQVVRGMEEFIDIHVKCFAPWPQVPVHFIGSVAHHFSHCLQQAAAHSGIRLGRIIQRPIDGLVDYHVKYRWV